MKVYLAGPISGRSYDDVTKTYQEKEIRLRNLGYTVLCPMVGKALLQDEKELKASGYTNPTSTNHAIFERDMWMVKQSDVVLADLTDSIRVSIGTVMELAWASMLEKHTIVVLPKDNIHSHSFILEAADIIFTNLDDAIVYLGEIGEDEH